ncbi:MAG: hypothetical protein RL291_1772 [Pseudomonadota bacterium]
MTHPFHDIVFTDTVKAIQTAMGSREMYARNEANPEPQRALFGPDEVAFIESRESFYLGSVGETGWPYIQHRGGPAGFLKVLDERTLAFADFAGNRQYVTTGNLVTNDRVTLFLMAYDLKARLKIMGRAKVMAARDVPELVERIAMPGYRARIERVFVITSAGFDWNCRQHIPERYGASDVHDAIATLKSRITELESKLALKGDGS